MLYTYPWLRRLMDERGDIFGQYGFIWMLVALVAIAGLALVGTNLDQFFADIASRF